MIEKIKKYLNIVILIGMSIFIIWLIIGSIAMEKGVGRFHYSKSLKESKKEQTFINQYDVCDKSYHLISQGWLEYARQYNVFDRKTIDESRVLLSVKKVKKIDEVKDAYWEAFFRDKKLTAFEDKGIISVVGVDKRMDTIKLKPNKDEVFYIVKE